jgi:tRNA-dihydrouridine synthase C
MQKKQFLNKDTNGCPYLILAPMEGVGDRPFRKAMASIGGFDEAVTEFLRVPTNAHVKSLARPYQAAELSPIPLAAQLMGSDPSLMGEMAHEIASKGAHRIDLNCGCPSNTVTGRGAGSSLLKTPELLYSIAKAMVLAVDVPVTVKMRSGYEDTSLFKENLLAAQEAGISFLTLHPRTKTDGYGPPARWDLIAEAKALLKIPVVGNGDILNVADAQRMLKETKCDALMIGRGSVINPFIFHQIRADFSGKPFQITKEAFSRYLTTYIEAVPVETPVRTKINKMKQLMGFLFKGNERLLEKRQIILTTPAPTLEVFLQNTLPLFYSACLT